LTKALVDALYVLEKDDKKEGLVAALRQVGYKFNGLNPDLIAMATRRWAVCNSNSPSFR